MISASLLLVGGFVFLRIGTALLIIPAFGGPYLPGAPKIAFAFTLTIFLTPLVALTLPQVPEPWLLVAAREVTIGLLLGLLGAAGLWTIESFGRLCEFTTAETTEPYGPIVTLVSLFSIVLLFSTGAHRTLIQAIAQSYLAMPLAHGTLATQHMAQTATVATAGIISSAMGLAAPIFLVRWLCDLVVATAGHLLAPQASTALVGLRSLLLLLALLGTLVLAVPFLSQLLGKAVDAMQKL